MNKSALTSPVVVLDLPLGATPKVSAPNSGSGTGHGRSFLGGRITCTIMAIIAALGVGFWVGRRGGSRK